MTEYSAQTYIGTVRNNNRAWGHVAFRNQLEHRFNDAAATSVTSLSASIIRFDFEFWPWALFLGGGAQRWKLSVFNSAKLHIRPAQLAFDRRFYQSVSDS